MRKENYRASAKLSGIVTKATHKPTYDTSIPRLMPQRKECICPPKTYIRRLKASLLMKAKDYKQQNLSKGEKQTEGSSYNAIVPSSKKE